MVKVPKSFKSSYSKTAGVLAALLTLVMLVFLTVWIHDSLIIKSHDNKPKLSKDNNWGGLKISIDASEHAMVPVKGFKLECQPSFNDLYFEQNSMLLPLPSMCQKNATTGKYEKQYQEEPGSYSISGKIYLKNQAWLRSKKIPNDLLQLKYGGNYKTADIKGFTLGQFINARRGTSGSFTINAPYEAKDGVLILKDGNTTAEIK